MNAKSDDQFVVTTQTGATPAEANLLVAFTRMETKVDVVLTQHGAKLEDHETRLRAVEDRSTVSPKALWAAVTSAVAAGAALVTFLANVKIGV